MTRLRREEITRVRRENLKRLIARDFNGNQSRFARAYSPDNPSQSFINGLVRGSKSFADDTAWNCEQAGKLMPGQISIPNSPLKQDPAHASAVKHELDAEMHDIETDTEVQQEVLIAVRQIKAKFRKSRRKAG